MKRYCGKAKLRFECLVIVHLPCVYLGIDDVASLTFAQEKHFYSPFYGLVFYILFEAQFILGGNHLLVQGEVTP